MQPWLFQTWKIQLLHTNDPRKSSEHLLNDVNSRYCYERAKDSEVYSYCYQSRHPSQRKLILERARLYNTSRPHLVLKERSIILQDQPLWQITHILQPPSSWKADLRTGIDGSSKSSESRHDRSLVCLDRFSFFNVSDRARES
jgi:hypothetical protein